VYTRNPTEGDCDGDDETGIGVHHGTPTPASRNCQRGGGYKYALTIAVFALSFLAATSPLNAHDSTDPTSESEQQLRPSYPCIPMWEPVPSPFTPIWVPDWNTWIPAFSPDALAGMDGVFTARVGLPGWQPWNPLPPCRYPWPPIFTPIPWEPFDPPTQSQAIYLGTVQAPCVPLQVWNCWQRQDRRALAFPSLRPASPLLAGIPMSPRPHLAEPISTRSTVGIRLAFRWCG
jgi:hypothetical protein